VPAPGTAHGLGPHVVGQRVVVRRLLPGQTGPSGGPAMTDVLGLCTSWADGICVVRPEEGPEVAIVVADIVSGKPVPPRASVRQRVSARDAERHALPLWPDVERSALGDWELRTDPAPVGRLLKRTNSCLAIGDPGLPLAAAADRVVAFYAARGRDALVQVELDSSAERGFAGLGWRPVLGGDAHFLVSSLAMAIRSARGDGDVELVEDGPRARAVRRIDGAEVGSARAAVDGDWLGLHDLVVDPAHRRRGHAGALVSELLEWGAERGATTVWLHVETDNQAALALYGGLGFRVHHTCRYLAAPSA
jgi:ribosomal protein S18 acetylase RimI-like enzyme